MLISKNDLKKIRAENPDKVIVLGTGTFDLFHWEHLRYLEDAKKLGDVLVVAVKSNYAASLKYKKNTIIDEKQRAEIIDGVDCVDYVVIAQYSDELSEEIKSDNEMQKQWLHTFCNAFELLKPNILYYEINSDLQSARDRIFKKYSIKGIDRERTAVVSTRKIINRVVELYNK